MAPDKKFAEIFILVCGLWGATLAHSSCICAQTIYKYKSDSAYVCFIDKNQSHYIPGLIRKYDQARAIHRQIWGGLPSEIPYMLVTDLADDGNAGVVAIPHAAIQISLAPLNKSYFTSASTEKFDFLFKHEYTHIVVTDKAGADDRKWRNFTGNKVVVNPQYPLSALWSYLDAPRWYAPRWYQEGVACFMETWLCGGVGRSLGGYDETYFRTRVKEGKDFYSVVGLETEGTTSDVEQGSTAYLYGTRFINYLVLKYGYDKLIQFYNRTDDSKKSYVKQFEYVYGKELREVWDEWGEYEKEHQRENLEEIAEYPLTELKKLTEENLGAVSPLIVDEENRVIYAAVSQMGDFSQIDRIQLSADGKTIIDRKKLSLIDGSRMYHPAYLAYDKKGQRLIWTDRNGKIRGLVVYDLQKGKVVKKMKYQRLADICYDNSNDCLYGLMSNQGVCILVKYDRNLESRTVLHSFPFGTSVSDLDISHDGKHLVAAIQGTRGDHSLVMFETEELENGDGSYTVLDRFDDSNLSQFRFSADDSKLLGFSYYTGVPNVWSYDISSGDFNLVTNVQTGIFAPYLASDNTVYALEYSSEGMTPVVFDYTELHDANSVKFLGQMAFEANPEIAGLASYGDSAPQISFAEVYDSISVYKPLKEAGFQGIYPDISGFTDKGAWNNMTPVLGARMSFYDPLSLFSANLFVGASPWSNNEWKNKFHISADIKYKFWTLKAAWNPTNFYDLFGPRRSSRKGYQISLAYDYTNKIQAPFTWQWGASIAHYGDMDALPLYQEIEVDKGITSFQTANLYAGMEKVRRTIGFVDAEQGYSLSANAYTYLADSKFYPSIDFSGDFGVLLPIGQHNSFWLRTSAGHSFGDSNSALGNYYFGGFRNNYVDCGAINRFRASNAFPGARIDQIKAHSFGKVTGELDFCPIRFQNVGFLQCYPNYIQFCMFGNGLITDGGKYLGAGVQMNIQMVFFTHMKTTLSLGYARAWGNNLNQGEFLVSLKLL
ncbi:MAG: hypothetical protein MJY89_07470 [Bacteroidales bacterium]|nr:hypothetical protein [Bacteroidales bacterium]